MLVLADARAIPLRDSCVSCVVTSPPYWGLRDYGTARWEGGDGSLCDHQYAKGGRNPETAGKQLTNGGTLFSQYERVCRRCGAERIDAQIGLEATPDAYVAALVAVFREVRRVLRDDGTVWLNLGDSYAGNASSGGINGNDGGPAVRVAGVPTKRGDYLKAKDLVGIPWRVAFALQADGWYLRSDIIWHKPNPMPESVTDRPTKAHEYLFLLTKSSTYYYDAEAIAEPSLWPNGMNGKSPVKSPYGQGFAAGRSDGSTDGTRNRRSVWTIPTLPYAGAHFATMPEALVEPCILAGAPAGGLVLDPFVGSGTVGAVAERLSRRWIGLDLNPAYHELAAERTAQRGLRFDLLEAAP